MKNRDRVRALVAVAKNSPTSSAVHVDTIMGGSKGRRKKHRKPILQDVELDKARFASRSEAGRYAANMRWKGRGAKTSGAGTASDHQGGFAAGKKYERQRGPFRADPPSIKPLKDVSSPTGEYDALSAGNMGRAYETQAKPEKESSTLRNLRDTEGTWRDDRVLDKGFGAKNLAKIGPILRGEDRAGRDPSRLNPDAKDATAEDIEFAQKAIADIKAIRNPLIEQADKAIGDLDNGRADAETTVKTLRSIKRNFTSAAKATREAAKKAGEFPTEFSQNTVRSMTYTSKALVFDRLSDVIDGAIGDIVSEMRGKGSRAIYDVGKSKKQVRKADSPAWQTKEGKNPKGGLNAKGRASYKRETGGTLRPPVKRGDNPRRASFLARMGNMPGPERDANGDPTRLLLSLQAWGANSKAEARKRAKAISARNKPKK